MMSEDIQKKPVRPLVKGYIPYRGILTEEQISVGIPNFQKLIQERQELVKKIRSNRKEISPSL